MFSIMCEVDTFSMIKKFQNFIVEHN